MIAIEFQEPYRPRAITPLDPLETQGWRLKVYGIAYQREHPRRELEAAARALAARVLPQPAVTDSRYGVGFLGIHDGRGACFVFVDWWADENELHHHVFISPATDPSALEDHTASGLIACVWDLEVVDHERRAWIRHVLHGAPPELDWYLADVLSMPA